MTHHQHPLSFIKTETTNNPLFTGPENITTQWCSSGVFLQPQKSHQEAMLARGKISALRIVINNYNNNNNNKTTTLIIKTITTIFQLMRL